MPEIQRVSHRHEAILNHLIANPQQSLGAVAQAFGYTQAWLSCIVHSDAFQARLKEQQSLVFHHTILPITEKMQVVAHQALDRLIETLPHEAEPKNLSSIAGDVLDRLGFAAPKGGTTNIFQQNTQVNNHVSTLRDEIDAARALLPQAPRPVEVARNGDRVVLAIPSNGNGAAERIPAEGMPELGEACVEAAVPATPSPDPGPKAGDKIREKGLFAAFGLA